MAGALEGVPQSVHRRCEVRELLEVLLAERLQLLGTPIGEAQSHDAEVVGVLAARDQPGLLGAVDEPHRAVGADRRPPRIAVPANGEQQLVLGGREARGLGVLLTPAQEAAQTAAQFQEASVVLVGGRGRHRLALLRSPRYRVTISFYDI